MVFSCVLGVFEIVRVCKRVFWRVCGVGLCCVRVEVLHVILR